MRKLGQIPVHRGTTDAAKALHEAEEALTQHGAAVIFYPEGTCTRDPNLWPMVAKTGVARLALRTGAPVIPVAHWGEQHLLPYGTAKLRLFPRTPVEAAGPLVDLSRYREPLTATTLREATAEIMTAITRPRLDPRRRAAARTVRSLKARGQNLGPNNSETRSDQSGGVGSGSWGTAFANVVMMRESRRQSVGPTARNRRGDQHETREPPTTCQGSPTPADR